MHGIRTTEARQFTLATTEESKLKRKEKEDVSKVPITHYDNLTGY